MAKHTQTIRLPLPKNCLSVFDHFAGLALKGLRIFFTRMINYRKGCEEKGFKQKYKGIQAQ